MPLENILKLFSKNFKKEQPPKPKLLDNESNILCFTKLGINKSGKIAYIKTKDNKKLQKIMSMGIVPGFEVTLLQKFPTYVYQIGYSQYAIDKNLAEAIFVYPKN